MSTLPTGTVTFLFTDIEGSTRLAEQYPDAMPALLARHHAILRQGIEAHNGHVFQISGDAFCAAFPTAPDALHAAVDLQLTLQREAWSPAPVTVRMGINTGIAHASSADAVAGGYTGYSTLARAQRVMSTAYGGQILLSSTSAELLRGELSAGITLRDMGEHRLKGILNPERLWQAISPDLPQDFAPLQTLNAIPNNLPVQLTSFVGREKEIAQVRQLLTTTRLLTLTGSGGTGKTRLSLHVAAEVLDTCQDGAWFVELAPLSDPELVPLVVAKALGLSEEQNRPIMTTLLDYVRSKQLILVLDNCEHLIESCARFADTVLRCSRQVRILASSREALGIAGEVAWRVPSLPTPDPKEAHSIGQLEQYSAVRLFIERATSALATFTVTEANAPAIAQICYRLDGIPLAIELAAARVKALSAEKISERLDDRFRLLTGGSRTALARQQTLRATIDWSHDLLSEPERALWRRLAVFAGGWTLEAAEEVCSDGVGAIREPALRQTDILDLLTQLVTKSLVVLDERGAETRYGLMETIRQYARDKSLEAGETDQTRKRHLAFFLQLAETAEPELWGNEARQWLERLEAEHDNLRAALEWSMRNDAEAALRLAGALVLFWNHRFPNEALDWLCKVVTLPDALLRTRARAKALRAAGVFAWGTTIASQQWRTWLEESVAIFREIGEPRDVAESLYQLGRGFFVQYDWAGAGVILEESLSVYQRLGDQRGIARVQARLGDSALYQGEIVQARAWYTQSLHIARKEGLRQQEPLVLSQLGIVAAFYDGNLTLGRTYFEESEAVCRELGFKGIIGYPLRFLAELAVRQGDYERADSYLQECLDFDQESAPQSDLGEDYRLLAFLAYSQGNLDRASELYKESLILQSVDEVCVVENSEGLARVSLKRGESDRAIRLFGAAAAIRERIAWPVYPVDRANYDRDIAALRTSVSGDAFSSAWEEGNAMTTEQAIGLALGQPEG